MQRSQRWSPQQSKVHKVCQHAPDLGDVDNASRTEFLHSRLQDTMTRSVRPPDRWLRVRLEPKVALDRST